MTLAERRFERSLHKVLNEIQKETAEAIVNIFETGKVLGDYGNVTLLHGDSGHLTYGRSQTTLASGNLFLLIKAYVQTSGAQYADQMKQYLSRLAAADLSLDQDSGFKDLLGHAGSDPVMRQAQDDFFDRVYWNPALLSASNLGIASALGSCVVYDSTVHGSWSLMRDRTNVQNGNCQTLGEEKWISNYISVRRQWLATNTNALLQGTVYRMIELGSLVATSQWDLDLPLKVRGITIDASALSGVPVRASAQIIEERLLSLHNPMLQGSDVQAAQQALNDKGYPLVVDGVFGEATKAAVGDFQRKHALTVDGIIGPGTRAALSL